MDGRKNNGGHSTKGVAGRKSKAVEQKIAELLSPLEPKALKALKNALRDEEPWAVKLFFDYNYGKAKERVDITTNEESLNMPLINFVKRD